MKQKNKTLQHLGFIALAFSGLASQSAQATTFTWDAGGGATNTWSTATNWNPDAVPTFVAGDTFDLSLVNIAATSTSTMDTVGGNTLGTIKIGDTNNTNSWILSLTTALTLNGNGSAATINQISTSKGDTINGAGGIVVASDLNITNASGNILNLSTGITATGATRTITNNGSGFGRVNLNNAIGSGINLVQNSTNSATWMLASSASFNGTIAVKAGTFQVGATGANGIGLGTAAFTLGDTSGSSDATLVFLSGNGSGYSAPITVASGSTGIKSIVGGVTSGNNTYFLNSAITLGPDSSHTADVSIGNSTNNTSTYNVQGGITGFGNLTVKTTNTGKTRFATGSINNTGTLTNAGTSTGAAQIDSVVGVNVTGVVQNSSTSQMNLTAANTYTGATTVTAGTLSVGSLANGGSNSNIGASTNAAGNLVLNGGTLQYTGAAVSTDRLFSLQSSSSINASGSGAVNFTNTGSMGFNGGTAAKTLTLTGTNTGANTIAAVIGDNTGATSVTKSGAGTWVLSGANTHTGATTVSAGTLTLSNALALQNSALDTTNSIAGTSTAGLKTTVTTLTMGGLTGNKDLASVFTTTSGGYSAVTALTLNPGTGVTNTYSGVIANGAAGMTLTMTGLGTQTFSGANTYTGATAVNTGTLKAGVASVANTSGAFGNNSAVTMANVAGATLDITGFNTQIGSLTGGGVTGGNVVLGAATLTTGGDNTSPAAYAGVISGTGGALTKIGTGTLTLTGTNTYTGNTTVNAGKLVVNGNSSTSVLTTVNTTATLGGSGTIGALVVMSGGTVAPGNSPGILSVGNTDLQAGSTLGMDINGSALGTGYDQLNINGTVSLANALSLNLGGYTPVNDTLFFILANDGTDAITGTFSNASIDGSTYTLDGQDFRISYFGDSTGGTFTGGNDVVLMAVPEPGAALLGGLGVLALLRRRRVG
ncbi:MAG: autotransporter-associated beta strand repeat-containing protein [Luteolibacter sp.]